MARSTPDKVRHLNQQVSLERLVAEDGIDLYEVDGMLGGACPLHPEGEVSSLIVDVASNTWECPGCGVREGGPVEWVMNFRNVSRAKAVDMLMSELGDHEVIAWPDDDAELLDVVTGYYNRRVLQSDDARTFLEKRGLRDLDLVRYLRLGVADRTLGYRLPSRNSTAGVELRVRLQTAGVLRSSGHEHLAGSLVVPVLDVNGVVVDMYGRKVSTKLRGGTAKHLFLTYNPPNPWMLDPAANDGEIIVTASVLDALTWWAVGKRSVLVTPTMEMGHDPATLLGGQPASRVVFAYRRTDAAQEVVQCASQLIADLGMGVYRIVFPEGQDANDVHIRGGDLTALLRNAEWIASAAPSSTPPPTTEPAPDDNYPTEPDPHGDEVVLNLGDRRWRVRGLARNTSPETLRVNVMVMSETGLHVDTFDLYSHRYRSGFTKEAASELGVDQKVIKADLGRLLLHLEELQDKASDVGT